MNSGVRGLTWSNTIAIERLLVWKLLSLAQRLLPDLLGLLGRPKPPTPLLVHLGARCDTIHSHEEQLLGLDLGEEVVDICENRGEDLLFAHAKMGILIVGM